MFCLPRGPCVCHNRSQYSGSAVGQSRGVWHIVKGNKWGARALLRKDHQSPRPWKTRKLRLRVATDHLPSPSLRSDLCTWLAPGAPPSTRSTGLHPPRWVTEAGLTGGSSRAPQHTLFMEPTTGQGRTKNFTKYHLTESSHQGTKVRTISIPTVQMRKRRPRKPNEQS